MVKESNRGSSNRATEPVSCVGAHFSSWQKGQVSVVAKRDHELKIKWERKARFIFRLAESLQVLGPDFAWQSLKLLFLPLQSNPNIRVPHLRSSVAKVQKRCARHHGRLITVGDTMFTLSRAYD